MSVRVNLLPQEVQASSRATRERLLTVLAVLVVLAVLGVVSFLQQQRISDAETTLADVQDTNTELRADIAALQPFADLESRAASALDVLGRALGREASMAVVLQDLSAVLPPNAEITTLSITFAPDDETPSPGGDRLISGRITATGQVLGGVAPGVERLVIDLDRVAAFDNAFVTSSTVNEEGVAAFTLEVELGPEVLTERYGLVDAEVDQ